MPYPYVNLPTRSEGPITNTSGNAARDTAQFDTATLSIRDVSNDIFYLDSTVTPFTTTLTSVGKDMSGQNWKASPSMLKEVAKNYKFEEFESILNTAYCTVSGIYAASGPVTITVAGAGSSSAFIFTPGDIVMNYRTGEHMLVATVASATTITVAAAGRAFGTSAAAAGVDGDSFVIVGSASEENGIARDVNSVLPVASYNLTQILKKTIAASGTSQAMATYGGKDYENQKRMAGIEHARSIERAFLFGERKSDTTGTQGKPRRTTGGVREGILTSQALVQDQNGLLTAPDLNAFLREGFTYGSVNKTLMAGGNTLGAVSEIARGQLRLEMGEKTYGLSVSEWVTSFGTIKIVLNPTFAPVFANEALLLDYDCFKYRYLEGRDTKLMENIQQPDMDGTVSQFLTECGLERRGMSRCALLRGVQA